MSKEAEQTDQTGQGFGREGNEVAAGYKPLDTGPKVDADRLAMAEAIGASQLPEQETEPVSLPLTHPQTGEEIPENTSLTAEQASEMVSRNTAQEAEADQYMKDLELQSQIDAVQASAYAHLANPYVPAVDQYMAQQQAAQAKAQQQAEAKAEAAQQDEQGEGEQIEGDEPSEDAQAANEPVGEDGLTESTRALLSNPQIRAELEQGLGQVQHAYQQYVDGFRTLAQQGVASLMARYPEFNGLTPEQTSGALSMMQQNDPMRFNEIARDLQKMQEILNQFNAVAQQQQQHAQQQKAAAVHQWTQQQDAAFEDFAAKEGIPHSQREELAREAQAMLRESMTDEEMQFLWNGSILRSLPAQKILLDATRYRMAKRGATQRAKPNVPPVQKPGQGFPQSSGLNKQIAALESKSSLSPKEAAQLVELQGRRRSRKAS